MYSVQMYGTAEGMRPEATSHIPSRLSAVLYSEDRRCPIYVGGLHYTGCVVHSSPVTVSHRPAWSPSTISYVADFRSGSVALLWCNKVTSYPGRTDEVVQYDRMLLVNRDSGGTTYYLCMDGQSDRWVACESVVVIMEGDTTPYDPYV